MKLRALSLCLFLVFAPQAHADERLDLAREYVTASRVSELLANSSALIMRPILEQMLSKEASLSAEMRKEFIERFETKFLARAPEMAEAFAKIMADEFTADELREATAFVKSPVGQHLLDFQPVLMQKGSDIGKAWGEQVGREAIEEVINEMRSEGKLKTL
jgi:hypothetical protein